MPKSNSVNFLCSSHTSSSSNRITHNPVQRSAQICTSFRITSVSHSTTLIFLSTLDNSSFGTNQMENMRRNILKGFDIRWLLVWLRTGACVCNALCPPKCINKNLFRSVAISANCICAFIILAISRFAIFKYMSCTSSSRCGPTFSNDCILVLSLDEIVGGKFMGLRCVCFLCKCVCEWVFVF